MNVEIWRRMRVLCSVVVEVGAGTASAAAEARLIQVRDRCRDAAATTSRRPQATGAGGADLGLRSGCSTTTLIAFWRHRHHRLNGSRHSPRMESDAKLSMRHPRAFASCLASASRRSSPLKVSAHGLVHGASALRQLLLSQLASSTSARGDVSRRRERPRPGEGRLHGAPSPRASASTASPERDGRTENDPPRDDDLGAPGPRERTRQLLREAPPAPGVGTSTGSTWSTGGPRIDELHERGARTSRDWP